MALEAVRFQNDEDVLDYTPAADMTAGTVIQTADGRAAVPALDISATKLGSVETEGVFEIAKTTGIVILDGGRVFWDYSANKAHFKPVNDRDFYVGTAVGDASSAATTMKVNLNNQQVVEIDILEDRALVVPVGTIAAGGFGYPKSFGGALGIELTATNEAQKADLLSAARRAVASNPIVEAIVTLAANGSTNAVDISVGLANGTHATDADAIPEHVLFHVDGGDLSILAQSKDGTTTVAATDTTVDLTAGTAEGNKVELWIDARDPSDVQLYVDGVNVLPATVFSLAAATGPLGLLVHIEKTSSTATAGPLLVDRMIMRTAEQ